MACIFSLEHVVNLKLRFHKHKVFISFIVVVTIFIIRSWTCQQVWQITNNKWQIYRRLPAKKWNDKIPAQIVLVFSHFDLCLLQSGREIYLMRGYWEHWRLRQNTIAEIKLKKALEKMIGNWQIQGFTIFYDTLTFCRQKPQTFELEKKEKSLVVLTLI